MIRKNPHGILLQIHPSTFVDPTAMLCGLMIFEELVLGYKQFHNELFGLGITTRRRPHHE